MFIVETSLNIVKNERIAFEVTGVLSLFTGRRSWRANKVLLGRMGNSLFQFFLILASILCMCLWLGKTRLHAKFHSFISPFLVLGVQSPTFLHPKLLKMAVFGCKKMGLLMPKSKKGHHFLSPTIPKKSGTDSYFTWISFSGEFWANLKNRVFWPIFSYKNPKSKTYGANGQ